MKFEQVHYHGAEAMILPQIRALNVSLRILASSWYSILPVCRYLDNLMTIDAGPPFTTIIDLVLESNSLVVILLHWSQDKAQKNMNSRILTHSMISQEVCNKPPILGHNCQVVNFRAWGDEADRHSYIGKYFLSLLYGYRFLFDSLET